MPPRPLPSDIAAEATSANRRELPLHRVSPLDGFPTPEPRIKPRHAFEQERAVAIHHELKSADSDVTRVLSHAPSPLLHLLPNSFRDRRRGTDLHDLSISTLKRRIR